MNGLSREAVLALQVVPDDDDPTDDDVIGHNPLSAMSVATCKKDA
jgi:inorganic pyrophosphatase